ncbi:integrase arm-type DNA-binding domain-containing protein [Bradyrhizobium sp. ma5]|uniref:integrase arm-type DNA-binding domain-containing protein n=1 Tax=Bradyrhizobium sp. ma5 TaxID=3344828 RepID=UPI0035D40BD8
MAVSSITIRAVQALKPGEAIWDADHRQAVRGFGVRRQRDQATYVLKYRVFGRQRFVTIGPHGAPWTPELARREAKRLLGLVADGKDPADEKAKARMQAADTLRVIADQYLRNAKQRLRPTTYSGIERYLLVIWKPLHPVSVFQITRRHISARIADIASRHGKVSAARARTALSSMFNWAIREGLDIAANPVLGTNRPAQPGSREAGNGSSPRRSCQPSGGPVAMTITDALCVCCSSQPNAVTRWAVCNGPNSILFRGSGPCQVPEPRTIASTCCHWFPPPWPSRPAETAETSSWRRAPTQQ